MGIEMRPTTEIGKDITLKKLQDQNLLADIFKKDESKSVRKAAIKKITDQDILNTLFNESPCTLKKNIIT